MQLSGMVRVLAVAAVAASVTAWVAQDGQRGKDAGPPGPQQLFIKPITVELGDDHMVNLKLMVGLGPRCTVEGEEGKQQRPLVISSVFDYGQVLTDSRTFFVMVDAAKADAVPTSGGGADPDEAKDFARLLLGLPETKSLEGETLPRWRIVVKPTDGHTWGEIAGEADLSATWEMIPPKAK